MSTWPPWAQGAVWNSSPSVKLWNRKCHHSPHGHRCVSNKWVKLRFVLNYPFNIVTCQTAPCVVAALTRVDPSPLPLKTIIMGAVKRAGSKYSAFSPLVPSPRCCCITVFVLCFCLCLVDQGDLHVRVCVRVCVRERERHESSTGTIRSNLELICEQ